MNKQKTKTGRGIEWTDYTLNAVRGCQHGCMWHMPDGSLAECYAKTVAEGVARAAYPQGFAHHYLNLDALARIGKLKTPSRIFMDSMSDVFGHWVADESIRAILDACRAHPQHTFQVLTKNAPRLLVFADAFPPNVWVGVSVPPTVMNGKELGQATQRRMLITALSALSNVQVPVRWLSLEPLSWDVALDLQAFGWKAARPILQWAVIGAATNGPRVYQSEPAWVERALQVLDAMGAAVFFKGNLRGNPAATPWREEFPA